MTLKQVWRFLRDTNMISANSTIAQFNRVYNDGAKNHFTLLGSKDQSKFDKMYGPGQEKKELKTTSSNISDDEEENVEEVVVDAELEDTHNALKIVL